MCQGRKAELLDKDEVLFVPLELLLECLPEDIENKNLEDLNVNGAQSQHQTQGHRSVDN